MAHRREYSRLRTPDELASLDSAFRLAAQGRTLVAPEDLSASRRLGLQSNRKGSQSERNVARALSRLSYVSHVQPHEANGLEDVSGRDITVYLRPTLSNPLDSVGAQVKSSMHGVREFRDHIAHRIGTDAPAEVSEWLAERRLVILNGQERRETIQGEFLSQLTVIRRTLQH